LPPRSTQSALHSRWSPQVARLLEFVDRSNPPTVAQFTSKHTLVSFPVGLYASNIPSVRGGCVGLSGHRLTSARQTQG
jgi:hypothetical protein